MNSSVWAILAAQGSKEKNGFEVFLTTFEGGLFNFLWAKNSFLIFFWKCCCVRTKKFHKMKRKNYFWYFFSKKITRYDFWIAYHSCFNPECNVCHAEKRTKRTSNILLCLVHFSVWQTLRLHFNRKNCGQHWFTSLNIHYNDLGHLRVHSSVQGP